MKKVISIFVAVSILFSCSTVMAAGQKTVLSIEEARKIAAEKSKQAFLDDLNMRNKEIILKDSVYTLPSNSAPVEEYEYKANVEPIEIETNLELAKRTKVENLKALDYEAYKAATDVILLQKQLDIEKQKLSMLQDKYSIIQAKYKQKTVTENEVNDIEYSLESKKNDVNKAADSLEAAKLELQRLLDMDINEILVDVKDEIKYSYEKYEDTYIGEVVAKALETNSTVYEKAQNLKMKDKYLERLNHYVKQGNSAYDNAYYDLQTAKLELSDAKADLEISIRNKYNDLLNQQGRVEVAEKYATLMTKKFAAAEAKYKNGTINKESYLGEKEKYLDAGYQRLVEIHDYNILKLEFENLIS